MNYTKEELEKLESKNSFLIQKSMYEDIKIMTENETHFLLMAVFEYSMCGVVPKLDGQEQRLVKSAFNRFKMSYDKDSKSWLKSCKRKSEVKKEWHKKKKTDDVGNPLEHPQYK